MSVRDIFLRFDGFLRGITSQPASHLLFRVLFLIYFLFLFFWVCVGCGLPPFGYIQTRCCVYFHLSACLHAMLPLLCLLFFFFFFFDLIRFGFGSTERRDESTRPHVQTRERQSISAGRSSSRGLFAHIHIYGIPYL